MKLEIETWLQSQVLSSEAESCFDESFRCFKVGANKAAFIFSYLGFMTIVRDRILNSSAPTGFSPSHWAKIQAGTRHDEDWDKSVFHACQQKTPAQIFVISDDLRQNVLYWKNRRNDCAHSKSNVIEASHVQSLWAFIRSHLGKFVVNGSASSMTKRIQDHYDLNLTPRGQPLHDIVSDIPHSIAAIDLKAFFQELSSYFNKSWPTFAIPGRRNPNEIDFLTECYRIGNTNLKTAIAEYILSDNVSLLAFLRHRPEFCSVLSSNTSKVRKLWRESIFRSYNNDYPLLISLLIEGLIPESEVKECLTHLIDIGSQASPNMDEHSRLESYGFCEILREKLVKGKAMNDFDWANKCRTLICFYISVHEIDIDIAKSISSAFASNHHPWHLRDELNAFFTSNPGKISEYKANMLTSAEVSIPDALESLK